MNPTAEARAAAYRLLRMDLYGHLDDAEFLAMKYETWREIDADHARKLIPDLVAAIRAVLLQHENTPQENCRFCGWPWPCPTVLSIRAVLKDPEREFLKLAEAR